MKRTFFALLLIISTAMTTACGDKNEDKTPEDTTEQKLIGVWKITLIGLDSNGKEIAEEDDCTFWELLKENKGNELGYKLENNECILKESNQIENIPFTWRAEGDYFVHKYNTGTENKIKIKTLTETIFEIERERFDDDKFDAAVVRVLYRFKKAK